MTLRRLGLALSLGLALTSGARPPSALAQPSPGARSCAGWTSLSRGVSVRRCEGGAGHAAVLLSGWAITASSARRWAEALDDARLASLGFSTLYAVEGPADVDFRRKEIAVDALLANLVARASGERSRVLVVAHSSGAHVAATLFDRAFRQHRGDALRGRVAYVDLDGDRGIAADPERHLSAESVAGLHRALFVAVEDRPRGLRGFSYDAMTEGHRDLPRASDLMVYDASSAGCARNACAHLSLIHTRPSSRGNATYSACDRASVNVAWLARFERWLRD